jgi:hypothetical protein
MGGIGHRWLQCGGFELVDVDDFERPWHLCITAPWRRLPLFFLTYVRAARSLAALLFSACLLGAATAWRRIVFSWRSGSLAGSILSLPLVWRCWPVCIGIAISWETHAEASSVCYDRNAGMQNPFLSSHESLLFQSRTTPLSPNNQNRFDFFSLHACTWAGGLYGVCWDSNGNSLHHAADKNGH